MAGEDILRIGGISDRSQQCTLDLWWKDQKFEYTGTNCIYRGAHHLHDVSEDAADWIIWKFTYDVDSNCTRVEGPLIGTWTGRASLAWGV